MRWLIVLLVACHAKPSTAPSIYDLSVPLVDSHGHSIALDVDRGHPTLVSMFYGSCPAACPVLIAELGQVLAEVHREDVRVLLVSFDAARDTPAHLEELRASRHLDARWTLAAAKEPDARALAAVLGIKYRKLDDGEFSHTSAIIALDAGGRPIARTDRMGDHAAVVRALK